MHYEDRVRNLPVGANRRRGNPGKGKSALEFQPSEIVESVFSGSESDFKVQNRRKIPKLVQIQKSPILIFLHIVAQTVKQKTLQKLQRHRLLQLRLQNQNY